jgi:hypothetical protein
MPDFEFTVTFSVPNLEWNEDYISNKIFGSGLNDALVLLGIRDVIGLEVFRSAPTAEEAIKSVTTDIRDVFSDAVILEVKPDLVSIADIASLVGQSRQNLRKLVGFPPPTITGSKPFWHLFEIIRWYKTKGKIPFSDNAAETSKAAWIFNLQLEQKRLDSLGVTGTNS